VKDESKPVDGNKEIYRLTGQKNVCCSILSACDDPYGTFYAVSHRKYGRKVLVLQTDLPPSSFE